jgi:predicted transcriptional regulator
MQPELGPDDVADITKRLDRMDARSPTGAWTRKTLRLIADHPAVVSTELAKHMGMERFAFKAEVRKLKRLGLTHSLEVGYRLSPRGAAFLENSTR